MKNYVLSSLTITLSLLIYFNNLNKNTTMVQTLTAENDDAKIVASFRVKDSFLQISYVISNKTGNNLYLFNRLYNGVTPDSYMTDRNLVYIFVNEQQVNIQKAILPMPSNINAAIEVRPCITKMIPYNTFEEAFQIPIPLTPRRPYIALSIDNTTIIKKICFGIGYFVGNKQTMFHETQVNTSEGPAWRFKAFSYKDQKLLTVGPTDNSVAIFRVK